MAKELSPSDLVARLRAWNGNTFGPYRSPVPDLRAMLKRAAGTLNSLRAQVEGTLWPNSGFATPEPRDG